MNETLPNWVFQILKLTMTRVTVHGQTKLTIPSMCIRLILQGCTLPLGRKHQEDCRTTYPRFAAIDNTVIHTALSNRDLQKPVQNLQVQGPIWILSRGVSPHQYIFDPVTLKGDAQGLKNPACKGWHPTRLHRSAWQMAVRRGGLSFMLSWLVEISWSPKPNLLIKHCKTNVSRLRSCAWNNQRRVFQKPKEYLCLFSSLCRPAYSDLSL